MSRHHDRVKKTVVDLCDIPPVRRISHRIGTMVTRLVDGLYARDGQSGCRAYRHTDLANICTVTDRHEYTSEVIREIRRNELRLIEVPVHVHYTDYPQCKHAHRACHVTPLPLDDRARSMWSSTSP